VGTVLRHGTDALGVRLAGRIEGRDELANYRAVPFAAEGVRPQDGEAVEGNLSLILAGAVLEIPVQISVIEAARPREADPKLGRLSIRVTGSAPGSTMVSIDGEATLFDKRHAEAGERYLNERRPREAQYVLGY
jgi:hypothetical protein